MRANEIRVKRRTVLKQREDVRWQILMGSRNDGVRFIRIRFVHIRKLGFCYIELDVL